MPSLNGHIDQVSTSAVLHSVNDHMDQVNTIPDITTLLSEMTDCIYDYFWKPVQLIFVSCCCRLPNSMKKVVVKKTQWL